MFRIGSCAGVKQVGNGLIAGLSAYQKGKLGTHITPAVNSTLFPESDKTVQVTFGTGVGGLSEGQKKRFLAMQEAQVKRILGVHSERVGGEVNTKVCVRPCTPNNHPFVDFLVRGAKVVASDDLLLSGNGSGPKEVVGIHINGLSQAGWTGGPLMAKVAADALYESLKKTLDVQSHASVALVGQGPGMQHLLYMLSQSEQYFSGIDMSKVSFTLYDRDALKMWAKDGAAALHHWHLVYHAYPLYIKDLGAIVAGKTPVALSFNLEAATYAKGYLREKFFPTYSQKDSVEMAEQAARGWQEYIEVCRKEGLESGINPTGFLAIPLDQESIDSILGSAKKRGETGYTILSPEETAEKLHTSPHLYPFGSVFFGKSSLPSQPENGVVDRDQYFATVRTLVKQSNLTLTFKPMGVADVSFKQEKLEVKAHGESQAVPYDFGVVMPGLGVKEITGLMKAGARAPFGIHGVVSQFTTV